jgi:hypothetical protein
MEMQIHTLVTVILTSGAELWESGGICCNGVAQVSVLKERFVTFGAALPYGSCKSTVDIGSVDIGIADE